MLQPQEQKAHREQGGAGGAAAAPMGMGMGAGFGMMLPGMASGWIQAQLGYANFFVWVCVATLPSIAVTALVKIPPDFGRKAR